MAYKCPKCGRESDQPGTCPDCGVEMVEEKEEKNDEESAS